MADELSRVENDNLCGDDLDAEEISQPPTPKRVKMWQETLINLVVTQQQQLAELANQTKMAMSQAPLARTTPSSSDENAHASSSRHVYSFHVTSYDPDKSAYSIKDWLDDVTQLKRELNVSDIVMIAKAGDALKRRAYKYFCDWRPISRTWENFCNDLTVAFPDRETPGARAYTAATLSSRDCESLCDYGNKKIRAIKKFHDELPWDTILGMVEYNLNNAEAQSAIRIQKPSTERELMKLLSEYDARRISSSSGIMEHKLGRHRKDQRDSKSFCAQKETKVFKGACFKCGQQGHQQSSCRSVRKENSRKEVVSANKSELSIVPTCAHCKKMGHMEINCWYKSGKPKKALILKK